MKFVEYPDADMMLIDLADTLASELNMALMTTNGPVSRCPAALRPARSSMCFRQCIWTGIGSMWF